MQMLLEQGYDALRIGAVAERANVGRSTLYEHYRTKQDLLEATLDAPFSVLAELVLPGCATDRVIGLLQHFRQNQQVARVLLSWQTRPVLSQVLSALILRRLPDNGAPAPVPLAMTARQIADAQLAVVECWVLGRPALDVNVAAEALRSTARALASS